MRRTEKLSGDSGSFAPARRTTGIPSSSSLTPSAAFSSSPSLLNFPRFDEGEGSRNVSDGEVEGEIDGEGRAIRFGLAVEEGKECKLL